VKNQVKPEPKLWESVWRKNSVISNEEGIRFQQNVRETS